MKRIPEGIKVDDDVIVYLHGGTSIVGNVSESDEDHEELVLYQQTAGLVRWTVVDLTHVAAISFTVLCDAKEG